MLFDLCFFYQYIFVYVPLLTFSFLVFVPLFNFYPRYVSLLMSFNFADVQSQFTIDVIFLPVTGFYISYVGISRLVPSFSVSLCPLDMLLIRSNVD